jgi:O-antigen ligase
MKQNLGNSFQAIVVTCFFIVIALTPWVNSDSLIIPKLFILFSSSLYFLPVIFFNYRVLLQNRILKILLIISIVTLLDLILIFILSDAPFAQQFYGRTGRGLGFATELSLLVYMLLAAIYISHDRVKSINFWLFSSAAITSIYSILQRFGLDIFEWNTKTNGIIGTLGNPNFQSSFAAIALIPTMVLLWERKLGKLLFIFPLSLLIAVIFVSQSTQGYISALFAFIIFFLIFLWYKNKIFFSFLFFFFIASGIIVLLGMLNKGPLNEILYKTSVQSRGEFLSTGLNIIKDNPIFGVGIDSVGDYYLMYINEKTANGIGEFADHLHNYFMQYGAVGGIPLALLQTTIIFLAFLSFFILQKRIGKFDSKIAGLFCAFACYFLQSLISPQNISMMSWNAVIVGSLIGLTRTEINSNNKRKNLDLHVNPFSKPFSNFLLIVGIIIMYPYFNVDKQQLDSARTGNGNLAIESAISFPESTIRYSRIGQELLKSNLGPQALEVARSAVKFNRNAPSAWGLILANNYASFEERLKAQQELIRLDPFNQEIRNFVIPGQAP